MWERDVARAREREARRSSGGQIRQQGREEEEERRKKEAVPLVCQGQIGKCVSRINSFGVASMEEEEVRQQMASKYPARGRELPRQVVKGRAVPNLKGLREGLTKLARRRAPGTGGLRPEFLIVVGERMDAQHMRLLEAWGERFL